MTDEGFKHRLAAILSADVVGYSRLISENEVSAVRILNAYRDEMTALAGEYQVRVNVQLIKSSNGHRIWAERFDRQLDDLFTIQDEITEEIVTAMDVKLVTGEWVRRVRKVLRTPAARDCFYRGWQSMFGSTKEDLNEAQRMFEETIRLEPESALGYDMAAWH